MSRPTASIEQTRSDILSAMGSGFNQVRVSTPDRIDLSSTLGTNNAGLTVYDVDLKTLFVWSGTGWTPSGATGGGVSTVANVAALRAFDVSGAVNGQIFETTGYYTANDGGGGQYVYNSTSVAVDNGGTVIAPASGVGRYLLVQSNEVNVKQFGAKGDGITNDVVALQAAADAARVDGWKLVGYAGTYVIGSTWTLRCACDLSLMTVRADATVVSPAIRVGTSTPGSADAELNVSLPKLINSAKVGAGWAGFTTAVGVDASNMAACSVTISRIQGFGVGLKVGGYGAGNAYNTYTIDTLLDNLTGIYCIPGDLTGWSNQNLFVGGRIQISSLEGNNVAGLVDIKLRRFDPAGAGAPNNNTFINISVEGNGPQYHMDIQGTYNLFQNCRFEASLGPKVNLHAVTGNETSNNLFLCGYSMDSITWSYSGAGTSNNNSSFGTRNSSAIDASGVALNLRNTTSGGITGPHLQGFNTGTIPLGKTNSATDWTYRLYSSGFALKVNTDANPRVIVDWLGKIQLGTGTVATPEGTLRYNSTPAAITSSVNFTPETDNNLTLGAASYRWSVVYAGNGTINTSDREEKCDIEQLTAAEKRVGKRVQKLICKFRFRDAVALKGDGARVHVGVIAQDVVAAFEAEGLDAFRYGAVCRDEWKATPDQLDADGNVIEKATPAGVRFGVRYDQLLALVIASMD